ncbi:MAG: hypothetical protein QNJ69_06075 [Gammaproteobacteria bacterium]|nr:hypothetical protein [Gammaproteobacteria bacterium]
MNAPKNTVLRLCRTIALVLITVSAGIAKASSFHFFALGDTAYNESDYKEYESLIDRINADNPAFSIHVGDTIGYQTCSDETYDQVDRFFNRFEQPLVYIPGDNEWADCYEPDKQLFVDGYDWDSVGAYRLERLGEIRKRYFSSAESLGQKTFRLTRQTELESFDHFESLPENSYWMKEGVLFTTVHVVGSMDSFHPHIKNLIDESVNRRHAGYNWMIQVLKKAQDLDASAVVVATHAEMFEREESRRAPDRYSGTKIIGGKKGPYAGYVYALANLANEFKKPVLLIHGDAHRFVIDTPLKYHGDDNVIKLGNFTRLQVFGHPELRAVKIRIDTSEEQVFSFSPF